MSWNWDGNFDDENDVDAGVIIAISAGVIVFFGIVVAVIEKTSPENGCFRVLDRNLHWIPFAAFFVMVAIGMITATSAEPGSNLPCGVDVSCFLAWVALIVFVSWRARKRTLTNIRAGRNPLDDGTGDSSTVFAVPIDCDVSTYDNACGASDGDTIDTYASQIHHPDNYRFYSSMTSGGGGFDGGSGFSGNSGDTGGTTTSSSSTGDSGGGGC